MRDLGLCVTEIVNETESCVIDYLCDTEVCVTEVVCGTEVVFGTEVCVSTKSYVIPKFVLLCDRKLLPTSCVIPKSIYEIVCDTEVYALLKSCVIPKSVLPTFSCSPEVCVTDVFL